MFSYKDVYLEHNESLRNDTGNKNNNLGMSQKAYTFIDVIFTVELATQNSGNC